MVGERADVATVELRLDLGDVGLDHPGHRPDVAGHLQRHPVYVAEALGEQRQLLGGGFDPPGRTDLAPLADRDLAEVAVDV
jgi:hypothetical protein